MRLRIEAVILQNLQVQLALLGRSLCFALLLDARREGQLAVLKAVVKLARLKRDPILDLLQQVRVVVNNSGFTLRKRDLLRVVCMVG